MPQIFYKYRSDSEFTDQIFTSGQVYLSTAEGLNDPFECSLQEMGREWIAKKVSEMKQAGIVGFLLTAKKALDCKETFFGLSGTQIKKMLTVFHSRSSIDESYAFYVEFIRQHTGHPPSDCDRLFSGIDAQLNSVGIFSMSAKSDHPLMWAHYAGEHTGICIGFESTVGSKMDHPEHFLPVRYSDSLPEMAKTGFQAVLKMGLGELGTAYTSSFKIAFSDKSFQAAITTKPTCWGYEEEWRYIEPYPGLFEWPGRISELTFGLRCNDERREHFVLLAEKYISNEVSLYQIRKRWGSNLLERCIYEKPKTRPETRKLDTSKRVRDTDEMSGKAFAAKIERLIRQEQYGEALFQVDENLKTNPGDPILLNLKGLAHGCAHQPHKAMECFRQLIRNHPEFTPAWYQMSCALVELGRNEEAISALRQAVALDPNDASAAFNLGVQLFKVQQSSVEALVYLRRAERQGHRRARQAIAEIETQQG